MVISKTRVSAPNFPALLLRELQRCAAPAAPAPDSISRYRFVIAYSAGLDSSVLLHALAELRMQGGIGALHAVHVHHGLMPQADGWVLHARQQAAQLAVSLDVVYVDAKADKGESPEARARDERYKALRQHIGINDVLLTAHHQDDQAETVLLQLLRGSGVRGLSAMPSAAPFAEGWHWRPLLGFGRDQLTAYARDHRLTWVEDPSNASDNYDRNFLRQRVMPLLESRWPSAARTLSRSATVCGEAREIIDDMGENDLAQVRVNAGLGLRASGLLALTPARRRNALMLWLQQRNFPAPSAAQLQQIESAVLAAKIDSAPLLAWGGIEIRRYDDVMYAQTALQEPPANSVFSWNIEQPFVIKGVGVLSIAPSTTEGLSIPQLKGKKIEIRFRQGGETCQPLHRAHTHELKKLMQEARIPPWQRQRLPMVYVSGELVYVAGIGKCGSLWQQGRERVEFTWRFNE